MYGKVIGIVLNGPLPGDVCFRPEAEASTD
jgi:hypothetical protein